MLRQIGLAAPAGASPFSVDVWSFLKEVLGEREREHILGFLAPSSWSKLLKLLSHPGVWPSGTSDTQRPRQGSRHALLSLEHQVNLLSAGQHQTYFAGKGSVAVLAWSWEADLVIWE